MALSYASITPAKAAARCAAIEAAAAWQALAHIVCADVRGQCGAGGAAHVTPDVACKQLIRLI